MRAITIESNRLQYCNDVAPPVANDDEILIDVCKAGICETDMQLVAGYMDFSGILGHEFVGIARSGVHAGHRVVGEINCNCRKCERCDSGLGNHCAHRSVLGIFRHDGAFADQVAVPEHNLHRIPDSISDEEAVFVEPLAAAFQIPDQIEIRSTDRIAILGDGRLALMSAKVLSLHSDHIEVVGKHAKKLSRFDAISSSTTLLDQVDTSAKFDIVVDCTGSSSGLPLALNMVRPRGTVVMKTTIAANHDLSLATIVIDEIKLVGSRCGPFDKAISALAEQRVSVSDLVTHRFALSKATEAFEAAKHPDALKVVFEISTGTSHGN